MSNILLLVSLLTGCCCSAGARSRHRNVESDECDHAGSARSDD